MLGWRRKSIFCYLFTHSASCRMKLLPTPTTPTKNKLGRIAAACCCLPLRCFLLPTAALLATAYCCLLLSYGGVKLYNVSDTSAVVVLVPFRPQPKHHQIAKYLYSALKQRRTTRHHSKIFSLTLPDTTVGGPLGRRPSCQLVSESKYFETMSSGSPLHQTDK